jgi:DNA-binding NarL/FixJ family response regulator
MAIVFSKNNENLCREYLIMPIPRRTGDRAITPRELQVLELLALGYSSIEIGGKLNISCRTVENHSANLRRKLRVRNTVSLVRALLEGNVPRCSRH